MLSTDANLYHLAPEIALTALAILVILADLLVRRKGTLAWLTVVGLGAPAALVLGLWSQSLSGLEANSFNGALVVDQFALFFKAVVLVSVLLVVLASQDYVGRFPRFVGEYYGLILLASVGMMLVAGARELMSIYLALELTTFSMVALVAIEKDGKSIEAAVKYLLLSAVASAVLLYGMALIYGLTGTTYLTEIAARVRELGLVTEGGLIGNGALLMGFLFLIAGFGFKIATVPFQMWVPDVYEGAPTPVTAYLSVASKAAGFAILLRVFTVAFPDIQADWRSLFVVLATVSMFVGNLVAIVQTNVKRLLGYSTVAHAGYLMIGVAASQLGQSGVLFYLATYALTNIGAFVAVIALANRTGGEEVHDFGGLGRAAPFPAFVLAFCLISLTGVPPTAGFIAKVYIFNAAVQDGLVWLALVGVVNSVISAYYYWKVIRVMYLGTPLPTLLEGVRDSLPMRASLGIALGGVVLLGVAPQPVIAWAREAVGIF